MFACATDTFSRQEERLIYLRVLLPDTAESAVRKKMKKQYHDPGYLDGSKRLGATLVGTNTDRRKRTFSSHEKVFIISPFLKEVGLHACDFWFVRSCSRLFQFQVRLVRAGGEINSLRCFPDELNSRVRCRRNNTKSNHIDLPRHFFNMLPKQLSWSAVLPAVFPSQRNGPKVS